MAPSGYLHHLLFYKCLILCYFHHPVLLLIKRARRHLQAIIIPSKLEDFAFSLFLYYFSWDSPQQITISWHLRLLGAAFPEWCWVYQIHSQEWKHSHLGQGRQRGLQSPQHSPEPGTSRTGGSFQHSVPWLQQTLLIIFSKHQGVLQCFCHQQQTQNGPEEWNSAA